MDTETTRKERTAEHRSFSRISWVRKGEAEAVDHGMNAAKDISDKCRRRRIFDRVEYAQNRLRRGWLVSFTTLSRLR